MAHSVTDTAEGVATESVQTDSGRPLRRRLIQVAVILAFLVFWQVFSLTPTAQTAMFPGFIEVMSELVEMLFTAEYWISVGSTAFSWAVSILISLLIGVPLGLLIGRSRPVDRSTSLLIDFLRTIPSIALIPLAILILGATNSMVIFVAVFAATWPILIQSIYAARSLDPTLAQVSKSFQLSWNMRLRFVLAPDIMAFVWPGLRLAVTASLLVAVGAELIGGAPGIGSAMQDSLSLNQQAAMMAYVVSAAVLGLALNMTLAVLQERLLWWHPSQRKGGR